MASKIIQENNLKNIKKHNRVLTVSNLETMDEKKSQTLDKSIKKSKMSLTLNSKYSRKSPPPSQKSNIDLLNKTIEKLK